MIAARGNFSVRLHEPSLEDPWLAQLYDLVLVGNLHLPQDRSMLVASVHTAAMPVASWIRDYATSLQLSPRELDEIRRPECQEQPFIKDLAFSALARAVQGRRFIVAGDWNTCRKYAGGPQFFERASAMDWTECHQAPEERSFYGATNGAYQLDHAFSDHQTAVMINSCRVLSSDITRELSDHMPLVIDIALT